MPNWRMPLSKPDLTEADAGGEALAFRSGVRFGGPRLAEFEKLFAAWLGVSYAVAVTSAPGPVYLGLTASGLGHGDEIVLTSFESYMAATAVELAHAKPVFVDIDPISMNADTRKMVSAFTERTRAILAVHTLGLSVDVGWTCEQAETYNLSIIEDASSALGATALGKRVGAGHLGRMTCWTFGREQPISCGGGMLTTNDAAVAENVRILLEKGAGEPLDEKSCAIGTSQLARIDEVIERRQLIAEHYRGRLRQYKDRLILPMEVAGYKRAWNRFALICRGHVDRDAVVDRIEERGVQCGKPILGGTHLQDVFRDKYQYQPGTFRIAESMTQNTFFVPLYTSLKRSEVDFICDVIVDAINE